MATSSIQGVGSVSSIGLGSGLDVNSILTQLMAVERQPLTKLQSQATELKTQLSTFGNLQSQFATMRDKANALVSPTLWSGLAATTSDASAVKVATGANAVAGSYSVAVAKLATRQTVTSTALASGASTLNEGSLTITLGAWTGDPVDNFAPKAGAAAVTVAIGAGETSLAGIRDKINAANAGVTATIVNDSSGARLSLRSNETGAENGFKISASETVDDGNADTGLTALNFDRLAASSRMVPGQAAQDAEATINGVAIVSKTNELANVVDGLTLTLQKTTASNVELSVASDTASVKTAINDFVTAFNGLAGFLRTQTAYNAETQTGGPLQGDQSAVSLQSQLRSALNAASSASSTWTRLSDVGIAMKTDGSFEVNATKLDNALANLPELKKLLATDGLDTASSGFVRRFKRVGDAAMAADGTFDNRTSGLNASLRRNSQYQENMQNRLAATEARLRAQYGALDTTMSKLSNLSSYVSQQIAAYNNSNNNG
jgi:flagellar hook-associated protein 2